MNNWIPCKERLPEFKKHCEMYCNKEDVLVSDRVLVTHRNYFDYNELKTATCSARYTSDGWYWDNEGAEIEKTVVDIVAWMPFPTPYKED